MILALENDAGTTGKGADEIDSTLRITLFPIAVNQVVLLEDYLPFPLENRYSRTGIQ